MHYVIVAYAAKLLHWIKSGQGVNAGCQYRKRFFVIIGVYLLLLGLSLHSQACCQTCWLEERWAPTAQQRVGQTLLKQTRKTSSVMHVDVDY